MAPVWKNEGTNDGTVAIIDNYEQVQCGMNIEDGGYSKRLTLWHGDVKTILRIRSVQAMRMITAQKPYDQGVWIMPLLGLWHLRFNLLKIIHKIHWGGSSPIDHSCLQYAADKWDISNAHKTGDFQKLEELLIHSYQSRVLGLLLHFAEKQDAKLSFNRVEEAEQWLANMSPKEIQSRVERVIDAVNPRDFDLLDDAPPVDEEMFNHRCFIRHMDVYLLLRRSIQFADVGLLKQALRETCIIFQAKASRSENYAPELLRLLHACDSEATSWRLQRAIICNMLVNLAGKPGKTFEVDRLVEFLNRLVSVNKKAWISSTKPMEELLRQIALTAPYSFQVKAKLEEFFGRHYKGRHPLKDAAENIWMMAIDLCRGSYRKEDKERFSAYCAVNLISEGLRNLGENVEKYNQQAADTLPLDDDAATNHENPEEKQDNEKHITIDDVMNSFADTAF